MPNNDSNIQGFYPANTQIIDFQTGEQQGLAGGTAFKRVGDSGILLAPSINLPRRRIYLWFFVTSATAFAALFTLQLIRNNTNVGNIIFGQNTGSTVPTSSYASLFSNGAGASYAVQDSLYLYPNNSQSGQPNLVIIQPIYFVGFLDQAKINVNSLTSNITDVRIWIAILSTL
jgi:hypothetical protein